MEVVQDLIFGKPRWELPFAVLFGEIEIQLSPGIADGVAEQVMESNGYTPAKKAWPLISAGFKAFGRARVNQLFVQPLG